MNRANRATIAVASAILAAAAARAAGAEMIVERDIAYGPDPAMRFDVYRPPNVLGARVIFMVHGGGWRNGDKAYANVVENKAPHYTSRGYVFISTNYRLGPGPTPLDEADDVARAVACAQRHAREWGADPAGFILMGHSAGAHLVSLVTSAPDIASRWGMRPWLGTVSLDSAAYNVVQIMEAPHASLYDEAFGDDPALWRAASPILRLKGTPVPFLLVCSTQRATSCRQADAFAAQARKLGGRVTQRPEDLSHGDINGLLGAPGAYTDAVDAFLDTLRPRKPRLPLHGAPR